MYPAMNVVRGIITVHACSIHAIMYSTVCYDNIEINHGTLL